MLTYFIEGITWLSIFQNKPTTLTHYQGTVEIVGDIDGSCKYQNGQYCGASGCNEDGCTVSLFLTLLLSVSLLTITPGIPIFRRSYLCHFVKSHSDMTPSLLCLEGLAPSCSAFIPL